MSTLTNERKRDEEVKEKIEKIDFKMVTFSLAGKDYGIDIMKVKEIAKDKDFTYVPNSASFVRGVYNLRGDIISVIDLRTMFNLPAEKRKDGELENMIILRLDDHIIGVIVDSTDKVVGVNSETIQPTHPLFGDINVKYISGVVENDNRLYIILDVERIFGKDESMDLEEEKRRAEAEDSVQDLEIEEISAGPLPQENLDLSFISETLATFMRFTVSPLNTEWVEERYKTWVSIRQSAEKDVQLTNQEDASEFLQPFFSSFSERLFGDQYLSALKSMIPEDAGNTVSAWNPGCGKGYESYSLAGLLRDSYPDKTIKIWAHDNDLLSISSAPSLIFGEAEIPQMLRQFAVEGKNGISFSADLKDSIMFEYHDITHENPFPPVDLIVARDILSFLKKEDQIKLLDVFEEKLKPGGLVIIGENEDISKYGWDVIREGNVVAFKKE